MTEIVTSKFRRSLFIAPFIFSIVMFGLIELCVQLSAESYDHHNSGEIMATLLAIIILAGFYTRHAIIRFMKVRVGPDALVLHYLLINNKKTIDYEDILHESVVRRRELWENSTYAINGSRPGPVNSYARLKIELKTGEIIYLYKEYYKNFDELAEAIRLARFKLE